jgi:hypothetical protein
MNRTMSFAIGQQEPQEDWQTRVEHLEEWVRELLMKNQTLRMALLAEKAKAQNDGHFACLTADSLIS